MAEPVTGIQMVRDWVMAQLEAQSTPGPDALIGGVTIFEGQVTDSALVPTDEQGRMKPYLCVVFGGRGKVSQAWRGIVGSRHDLSRFVFGVECYDYTLDGTNRLYDRVVDILQGGEPPNAGEITEYSSGRIENPADVKQNHSQDGIGILFECLTGTVTPAI